MNREVTELWSDAIGAAGQVVRYGHWGRPVLAFPSEAGSAWDFENNGIVAAIADLLDAGRLKLYCVGSHDARSWSNHSVDLEERARRHGDYEAWIIDAVVPWIRADCGAANTSAANTSAADTSAADAAAPIEIVTVGCSLGAFHAANFALKRADLFPLALCFSGNYDPTSWNGWGERGLAAYFNNPMDYVGHLHGDHLAWLRERVSLLLVCGQGEWEDTTGSLPSTKQFAALLASQQIRHELDLWGHDVPHDWPSWRAQMVRHLPRFC